MTVRMQGFTPSVFFALAPKAVNAGMLKGLKSATKEANEHVQESARSKFGSKRANAIEAGSSSGGFINSFKTAVDTEEMTGVVGTFSKHAFLLDEGGVIKPKGKFLAIPEPGVRRGPRRYKKTQVILSDDGQSGAVVGPAKKGEEPKKLFTLVKQVTIDPRHYIEPAINKVSPRVEEILTSAIEAEVDKI